MNQIRSLQSNLLTQAGVQYGWFMRYGGASEGLFESLNGKKGIGDPDKNVDENRKRALATLCHPELDSGSSCDKDSCLRRNDNLVHILHEFKTGILEAEQAGECANFDAVYTTKSDLVLSQTTADCASVIIADTNQKVVALVHGSWHTLSAKIICDVVAKMKAHTLTELVAGIGPMICKNCYEFGPEAKSLFDPKYLAEFSVVRHSREDGNPVQINSIKDTQSKYLVDLKQMVIDQLQESGITHIDDLNICTKEDERFFSHRRSGANSGRMITLARL